MIYTNAWIFRMVIIGRESVYRASPVFRDIAQQFSLLVQVLER
jgi:hypothetical protein